jgi:hypothetical protein
VNLSYSLNSYLLKGRYIMLRSILAVVVGYGAMAALVVLSFTPAFFAPELVFETDGIGVTLPIMVFTLAMGVAAAVLGGYVAALVAGRHAWRAVLALAAIAFVLGVASAVHGLSKAPPTVSAEEAARMTPMEKAAIGREPAWYAFLLPFLGSTGIMAGGWLAGRRGRSAALPPDDTKRT